MPNFKMRDLSVLHAVGWGQETGRNAVKIMGITVFSSIIFFVAFQLMPVDHLMGQASSTKQGREDLKSLLCHTWNIGMRRDTLQYFPVRTAKRIQFFTGGDVIFTANSSMAGSWTMDARNSQLTISLGSSLWNYQIASLSHNMLILQISSNKHKIQQTLWRMD